MIKKTFYSSIAGLWILLLLYSCVKQQVPSALGFSGVLVSGQRVLPIEEPGETAFSSFIGKLSDPTIDFSEAGMNQEAKRFLPDTSFHDDLSLFGVELGLTDSLRLLYFEFSAMVPPESHSYVGLFSKGGRALEIIPIKEASFNGNAAVNVIDQEIIELEYYDVYDAEGYQELELAFEYFQIQPEGKLIPLTLPLTYSIDRKFLEASTRLLSLDELNRYSSSDLELMEMELLADYGQKFSSPKWQSYFDKQYWYTPRHEKVEQLLSGLELANLKKIRSLLMAL